MSQDGVMDDTRMVSELRRQLAAAEMRYRQLALEASHIAFELSPEGDVVFINMAVERTLGYTPSELFARNWWSICVPVPSDEIPDPVFSMSTEDIAGCECLITCRDGSVRSARVTTHNRYDADGRTLSISGYAVDITDQKLAQRALASANSLLEEVFASMHDAMLVVSLDLRTIIMCNPAVESVLGYSADELIGNSTRILYPDDESFATYAGQAVIRLIDDPSVILPGEMRSKDGRRVSCEIKLSRLPQDSTWRDSAVVTIRDVTDQRRSQQALSRYQLLSEHARDIMLFLSHDGRILEANKAAVDTYGYDREELLDMRIQDLRDSPVTDGTVESRLAIAAEKGLVFEATQRRRDGRSFPAEVSARGAQIGGEEMVLCIIRDISERRQVEEQLRRRTDELSAIIESAPLAILGTDMEGRVDSLWNQSAERIFGWSREEAIGSFVPYLPDHDRMFPELRDRAIQDGSLRGVEAQARTRDGASIEIAMALATLHDERGGFTGMVHLADDITQRKQTDLALMRQSARAEALVNIAADLSNRLDLGSVLQTICDETAGALHSQGACVMLCNDDMETLELVAASGPKASALVQEAKPMPLSLYCDYMRKYGSVMQIDNLPDHHELPDLKWYVDTGARSLVSIAMVREGTLTGMLAVLSADEVCSFDSDELALLRGLAHQAAQAIANARLYEEANRRLGYLQALRDVDRAIVGSLDLGVTLDIFLTQVTSQLGVHAADILLLDAGTQTLEFAKGRGFKARTPHQTRLRVGEGHAGRAAKERRRVAVSDLRREADSAASSSERISEGFVAYHAVPLIAKGHVQGVLEVFHRTPLDRNAEWMDFLEALAGQAAIAIDNARLFEAQQRANSELVIAYDKTLEGWSRALDLRDKETEGHSMRVTEMAVRLAKAMGMNSSELVSMRRGALLHDIGKLGVPDSILLKPGPLTEQEWDVMRKHPLYAFEMLSSIPFLKSAMDIPYCHHEKWDGSGYPRGLAGSQIPLAARVFAVVDVWDALSSDRPYRSAWAPKQVMQHILTGSGSHFDPEVVYAFVAMLGEE